MALLSLQTLYHFHLRNSQEPIQEHPWFIKDIFHLIKKKKIKTEKQNKIKFDKTYNQNQHTYKYNFGCVVVSYYKTLSLDTE